MPAAPTRAWSRAPARGGADLEPHAALVGQRRGETGIAPQRDRRSAGLPAEPMVGLAGVLERRADPDRQRPIGATAQAVDRGPQQLALPGASPSSRGPVAQ